MRMLLALCALGVLTLALAVLVAGRQFWLLDLITFFWPVLALVAVALLVLSLPFGGAIARLAALAAVGVSAIPFIFLPPAPDDAPGEKIRVLAANLYIGNPDPRPFVALLTRTQPDIVIMEETRSHFVDAVRGSGLYPFESEGDLSKTDDKKVFSRYPIREFHELDDLPGRPVNRHAMRLVVDTPAGPIVVYAVHPDTPRSLEQWHERTAYLERLTAALRGEAPDTPVVVAGDWNLPAHSVFFRDFFAETGYRFARPGIWLPITRFNTRLARLGYFGSTIDHVAVSPVIRVTDWKRGADIGSNHLPVIVDLALPASNAVASLQAAP
jgi:endonuclease/exonuclease/phosphatase (EEP) superfamily protein YafD